MSNQNKKIRIGNIKRDQLSNLWSELSKNDFIDLINNSNLNELSKLFGHMSSSSISKSMILFPEETILHIFNFSNQSTTNKILSACSNSIIKSIADKLDSETLNIVVSKCNFAQKERLKKELSKDKADEIEEKNIEHNQKDILSSYYTSNEFDNSLKNNIIDRIKDLEEREVILEKNYKLKEISLKEKIDKAENDLLAINKKIEERNNEALKKEAKFNELKEGIEVEIKRLKDEQLEAQQGKLEIKFPEYVDSAVNGLTIKSEEFERKAFRWNFQGGVALFLCIASAISTFIYGGYQFHYAARENIDWFFFSFLLIKGLIIITLFGSWAKYAFNIANAYIHEALKRSDRMHAIGFGKFYLEIYGNKVSQYEMKEIFENWNIDTNSAFHKMKEADFSIKQLEQLSSVINSLHKIKNST